MCPSLVIKPTALFFSLVKVSAALLSGIADDGTTVILLHVSEEWDWLWCDWWPAFRQE